MWDMLFRRREPDDVYATLRPGDLFGVEEATDWLPDRLARYLSLANGSALTFYAIVAARAVGGTPSHRDLTTAVWLTAIGLAIALAACVLLRLSRSGEANAIKHNVGNAEPPNLPPTVRSLMKKAAIKKLLAFRVMLVSALAFCIALYVGVKGLLLL